MRISIVGTGYVGLVTGVCLAHKGHRVVCVDIDEERVAGINRGEVPFHEPGLGELMQRTLGRGLRASTDLAEAVVRSDMTMIAVGTPYGGRRIDLRYVREASRAIGRALARKKTYHVVVVKSTVVPGTTEHVILPILERTSGKSAGKGFGLGMNPEFLSEGEAVTDCLRPDRIVLGGLDGRTLGWLERLYRPFKDAPVLRTDTSTAEMIKYTSNALLATLISFSNEIGALCEVNGTDCEDVMRGVHLSQYLSIRAPRGGRIAAPIVGFLRAGCGFGGSCLPKDVNALVGQSRDVGAAMPMMRQVMRINDRQPRRMLDLLRRHFPSLADLEVAVLGLAFKPGTSDVRESPAIPIVESLLAAGARVRVYDPVAMPGAERAGMFKGATYTRTLRDAVGSVSAALLVTAWPEFRALERLPLLRRRSLVVVDGRRMLDKSRFQRYEGIGFGTRHSLPRVPD
jgi:UDPglucose 6-dehydrogenase